MLLNIVSLFAILFALLETSSANPIEKRASLCTVTTSNFSSLSSIKELCSSIIIGDLTVPAGMTLDLTSLASGTTVTFEGKVTFAYKEWSGPLISVSGLQVTVNGAPGHQIDGNGSRWWDGKGSNKGKTKPKFFSAHKMTGKSHITNLNIKNTPVQVFSINNSNNLSVSNVTINNSDGDSNGGHNTDAFDVGSSNNIKIKDSNIYNQDDCLAVNSGSNIYFDNNYCSGGHGISIGSVGGRSDNTVNGVYVTNSQVVNSENGIRIKTVSGATGKVTNISYKGITLSNIKKYGIIIEGDYKNGGPTGNPTSGVPITDLTVSNVSGSVASSAQPVYILVKGASGWNFNDINITGGKTSKSCTGIPSGAGVSC